MTQRHSVFLWWETLLEADFTVSAVEDVEMMVINQNDSSLQIKCAGKCRMNHCGDGLNSQIWHEIDMYNPVTLNSLQFQCDSRQ